MISLYPYIEQAALYEQIRPALGTPLGDWQGGPGAGAQVPVALLLCPSDGRGGTVFNNPDAGPGQWLARIPRANYVAFFTGDNVGDSVYDALNRPLPNRRTPFTYNRHYRLSDIQDGTSNTILMSEVLTDPNGARGTMWTNTVVYARTTPNSPAPDVLPGWADNWCPAGANQPAQNLPCVKGPGVLAYPWDAALVVTPGARSRHPGGVQCVFGDGSVRFVRDSISLQQWQAAVSMAGGEVLANDW
jgi:prepilin-type processing-associated H-X9-DG protein